METIDDLKFEYYDFEENKYKNGKIYGIYYEEKLIYIGSTIQTLKERFQKHKSDINRNKYPIYQFMRENDLNKFEIKLIERFSCSNRKELRKQEGYYQKKYKDTLLNKRIECRTKKEYYEDNKEYYQNNNEKISNQKKEYYQNNKEKISNQKKKYRKKNKEKISNQKKQYYQNNREIKLQKNKIYRENNREILSEKAKKYYHNNKEKIECECGSNFTKKSKNRHLKTKKHIQYINSKK